MTGDEQIRLTIFGGVADENTPPDELGEYLDLEHEAMIAALASKPGDPVERLPWDTDDT